MCPTAALEVTGSTWPLSMGFWVSFVLFPAKEDVQVEG